MKQHQVNRHDLIAMYREWPQTISLMTLIVPAHHRRSGVASQFLDELKAKGKRINCDIAPISDGGATWEGLFAFYRKNGFVVDDVNCKGSWIPENSGMTLNR